MIRYFQARHLLWHRGDQLQSGQFFDFGNIGECLSVACRRAIQVAFPDWRGLCKESFKVYTLRFGASGELESWKKFDSGTAC